jgi:hypothetical protein
MNTAGKKTWAFAGGHIPVESTGSEPENTSRDEFCFLNAGPEEAQVEITLFYSDRDPVGPYSLKILPTKSATDPDQRPDQSGGASPWEGLRGPC